MKEKYIRVIFEQNDGSFDKRKIYEYKDDTPEGLKVGNLAEVWAEDWFTGEYGPQIVKVVEIDVPKEDLKYHGSIKSIKTIYKDDIDD